MQQEQEYADAADIADEVLGEIELILHMAHKAYDGRLRCGICGSKESVVLDVIFALPTHASKDRLPLVAIACQDCHHLRLFLAE